MHKELTIYAKWRIKHLLKSCTADQRKLFVYIHAPRLNVSPEETVDLLDDKQLNLALTQVNKTVEKNYKYGS